MMRYAIFFAYDGTAYHGWQNQPHSVTVQQKMEEALSLILRTPVTVVGAGRTDAGVHARQMACHLDLSEPVDAEWLCYRLNCVLPPDIAVSRVCSVPADWHARFSATSRTYRYYITTAKSPFNRAYTLRLHFSLDVGLMNQAAAMLLTHQDFGCFCKSHSDNKTNICRVTHAQWTTLPDGTLCFTITANRFLRNMVRAIVGTLIDVGKHRITTADFARILNSGTRTSAGESVPARALFLERVDYDLPAPQDPAIR